MSKKNSTPKAKRTIDQRIADLDSRKARLETQKKIAELRKTLKK